MSEINDVSRRFLADFIAARLLAIRLEKDALRQAARDQGLATAPRGDEGSMSKPTNLVHPLDSSRRLYL
jgi:hypothetical protein